MFHHFIKLPYVYGKHFENKGFHTLLLVPISSTGFGAKLLLDGCLLNKWMSEHDLSMLSSFEPSHTWESLGVDLCSCCRWTNALFPCKVCREHTGGWVPDQLVLLKKSTQFWGIRRYNQGIVHLQHITMPLPLGCHHSRTGQGVPSQTLWEVGHTFHCFKQLIYHTYCHLGVKATAL